MSANGTKVLGTVSTANNFCGKGASIYTRLTSGSLRHGMMTPFGSVYAAVTVSVNGSSS